MLHFFTSKKFFDEVLERDWTDKIHPISFFLTCFAIGTITFSFFDEIQWYEALEKLNDNEISEFLVLFELTDLVDSDSIVENIERRISDKLDSSGNISNAITLNQILLYLEKRGANSLSLKIQNIILENKLKKEYPLFVLFYLIIYWSLAHFLLKIDGISRSLTETVYVYIYSYSPFVAVIPVLYAITFKISNNDILILCLLFLLFLFMIVKMINIFRYTHNLHLVSLLCANVLANLFLMGISKSIFFLFKTRFPNLEKVFTDIISIG